MKKEIIKAVVGQIINMLDNNILEGYGNEHFEDWCSDGEVFDDVEHDEAFINECMELVRQVSPFVDQLTYDILKLK